MSLSTSTEWLIATATQNAQTSNFNPFNFVENFIRLLESSCGTGGDCDLSTANWENGKQPCFDASWFLRRYNLFAAADQILLRWWNISGRKQLETTVHVYRADISYNLMGSSLGAGDQGSALRWALLTQADDLLNGHAEGGGAGKQWLHSVFGMTLIELAVFAELAREQLSIVAARSGPESMTANFAENLLMRLALKDIAFEHLFSRTTTFREFPISTPYLTSLLTEVDARIGTPTNIGTKLENLATYLFLQIPGWIPRRNVFDENEGFENDIIVTNLNTSSNLTAELLGRYFLVECKNRADAPVGVEEVGYFLERMRLTHCSFGVIFATRNITGETHGERAARSLIRRAFHEDGQSCVVLDRDDLQDLSDGLITFWPLLLARLELFRFGRPRNRR